MRSYYFIFFIFVFAAHASAQDTTLRVITVRELFSLAETRSKQLEISQQGIHITQEKTEIAKSERLPEIGASVDAGYLSTIAILNPDFSWHSNVTTPHFTNNYAIGASEVLYKGGYINQNIEKSKLAEQLSELSFEKNKQEVKLSLLQKYLELFEYFNNRKIYLKNIELANKRLSDLSRLQKQGLVTNNDRIRSELQIKDFELDLQEADNNITIINRELCVYLGLPVNLLIRPDTTLVENILEERPLDDYLEQAFHLQPQMKATEISEKITVKNIALEKSARLPVLSFYAGDALRRPFLYTLEPLNIYYNAYQAGFKLQYNISSIYHSTDRIRLAKLEYQQEQSKTIFQKQQTEVEVHSAYTRYLEGKERFLTLEKSLQLANDNYRVVEKKYINQLAQITDILDASTAKLAAELRLSNARINIIASWYTLQKSAGNF